MGEIIRGVCATDLPYNRAAQRLYVQIGVMEVYPEHERRALAIKPGVTLTKGEKSVLDFLRPDGLIVSRFKIEEEFVGSRHGSGLGLFKNMLSRGVKPKLMGDFLVGSIPGHGFGIGIRRMHLTHDQLSLLYLLSQQPEDFYDADQLSQGLYGQSEGYANSLRGVTVRLNKALRELNERTQVQAPIALELKFKRSKINQQGDIVSARLLMEPKEVAA